MLQPKVKQDAVTGFCLNGDGFIIQVVSVNEVRLWDHLSPTVGLAVRPKQSTNPKQKWNQSSGYSLFVSFGGAGGEGGSSLEFPAAKK